MFGGGFNVGFVEGIKNIGNAQQQQNIYPRLDGESDDAYIERVGQQRLDELKAGGGIPALDAGVEAQARHGLGTQALSQLPEAPPPPPPPPPLPLDASTNTNAGAVSRDEAIEHALKEKLGDGVYFQMRESTGVNSTLTRFGFEQANPGGLSSMMVTDQDPSAINQPTVEFGENAPQSTSLKNGIGPIPLLPPKPTDQPPSIYRSDAAAEEEFLAQYKSTIENSIVSGNKADTKGYWETSWSFLTQTAIGKFILVALFLITLFIILVLLQGFGKLGIKQMVSVGVLFIILNAVIVIFFMSRHF